MQHPLIGKRVAIRHCDACGWPQPTDAYFGVISRVGEEFIRVSFEGPNPDGRPWRWDWLVSRTQIESIED